MIKKLTVLSLMFVCIFAIHSTSTAQARGSSGHSGGRSSSSHTSHSISHVSHSAGHIKGINSGSGSKTSTKLKFYKPTKTTKYNGVKMHTIGKVTKLHPSIRSQRYKPFYKTTKSVKQSGTTIHTLVRGHMQAQTIQ